MRKIVLLLILFVSVLSHAGDKFLVTSSPSPSKRLLESQLLEIKKPETFSLTERISLSQPQRKKTQQAKLEEVGLNSKSLIRKAPATLPQKAKKIVTKANLDSVIVYDVFNQKNTKQEFTYNDDEEILTINNYYWNPRTSEWDIAESYVNEYDEEGNLVMEQGEYSWGEAYKYEYTYENGLPVSETISYNFGAGWFYSEKHEYSYDERGNVIEWITYNYSNEEWEYRSKVIADYDSADRLVLQEPYYWDGLEWLGNEVKAIYKFDEDGNHLLYGYWEWQWETKEWLYNHKFEQVFENGKVILQQESFWNPDNKDWNGGHLLWGELVKNNKTEFAYDEQGRQISEMAYHYLDNEWVLIVSMEFTYTVLESRETECVRETYYHTDVKRSTGMLTTKYNAGGWMTYRYEVLEGIPQYEEFYIYDEVNNLMEQIFYFFENGIRYADVKWLYKYDKDNNQTSLETHLGLVGNDPETWGPFTKWTYEYENGVLIKMMGHSPDKVTEGFQWYALLGEEYEYDFSIPLAYLTVPGGYEYPYKVDRYLNYMTLVEDPDAELNFEELELSVEIAEYFYTLREDEVDEPTTIQGSAGKTFTIYPNPATDVLFINSSEVVDVSLYNVAGTKLLQTIEKEIDLSNLASGIYIIEVNGVKTKVIKK